VPPLIAGMLPQGRSETFFGDIGASCQEAASKGHCTKKLIRDKCCKMCECADKMKNTQNGGGATISINEDGECKAYNPHSHHEDCWDTPGSEMARIFGHPDASCGHGQTVGLCDVINGVPRHEQFLGLCCATCGGKPQVQPSKAPTLAAWQKPKEGCKDLVEKDFTAWWHKDQDAIQKAVGVVQDQKSCPHAMMMGLCKNADVKHHCCSSCTSDSGKTCVDKTADEVSKLFKEGLSCGLLAQAGQCSKQAVKEACCARCRKFELYPTCQDVDELTLKKLIGQPWNDEGEGGCAHAAALDKCEKSSTVHKACCHTCTLHRDIEQ